MKPIANINYATGFWGSGGNTFVFKKATPNPNDLNNYDPEDVKLIFSEQL